MILLFGSFAICYPNKDVYGQNDANIQPIFNITTISTGIYHVQLDFNNNIVPDDGCFVEMSMQFLFCNGNCNGTPIYTIQLPTADDNLVFFDGATERFVSLPTNFIYDYILYVPSILDCANGVDLTQISVVRIVVDFISNTDMCLQWGEEVEINYTIDHPFGVGGSIMQTCDTSESCTFSSPDYSITPPNFMSGTPLTIFDITDRYYCDENVHVSYAIPYGGCPPYTHTWADELGNAVPWYNPPTEFWSSVGGTAIPNVVAGMGGQTYTATITDAAGTSISQSIEYVDEINIIVSASQEVTADGCNIRHSLTLQNITAAGFEINVYENPFTEGDLPLFTRQETSFLYSMPGSYTFVVRDMHTNCTDQIEVIIPMGMAPMPVNGLTVGSGETVMWDDGMERIVNGNIVIEGGGAMYIDDMIVGFGNVIDKIIVREGGELHVTNSILRNSTCMNSGLWGGIRIEANKNIPHPDDPYAGHPDHGFVTLNNALIEKANVGVGIYKNDGFGEAEGGGILIIEGNGSPGTRTLFLNCFLSISTAPFRYDNASIIQHADFKIDEVGFGPHDMHNYVNISLFGVHGLTLIDNTFSLDEEDITVLSDNKGTGMLIVQSSVSVGQYDTADVPDMAAGNTFTNLLKGVDVHSLPSLENEINVLANNFVNVHRGVTISGNNYARVVNNTFDNIPYRYLNDDLEIQNSYGIYLYDATGCLASGNTLTTDIINFVGLMDFTQGIIIRNSGEGGGRIYDNDFYGNFGVATQFEGDNAMLKVNCNRYWDANNLYDWWIVDGQLGGQGFCSIDPDISNPNRNQWHPVSDCTGDERYHIRNDGEEFSITYLNDGTNTYLPTCFDPLSVNPLPPPNECGVEGQSNCAAMYFKQEQDIRDEMAAASDDKAYNNSFSELIHLLLHEEDVTTAKIDLDAESQVYTDKILTGTYTDEANETDATAKLAVIPSDTPENIDFVNLYTTLINGLSSGTGKARAEAEEVVREIANLPKRNVTSTWAETTLAYYFGEIPNRIPASLKRKSNVEELPILPTIEVYPNPTNNVLNIDLTQQISNVVADEYTLIVFNTAMQTMEKMSVNNEQLKIATHNYKTGVYVLHLVNRYGISIAVQKFVVIQ